MTLTLGSLKHDARLARERLSAVQKKMTDPSLNPKQKKALLKMLPLLKEVLDGRRRLVRLRQKNPLPS
jgi:hypothetical protein